MPTDTMSPEETQAALQKAETERDEALAKAESAQAEQQTLSARVAELEKAASKPKASATDDDGDEDEDEVDLAKADPAVRRRIEKAEAEAKQTRERAEKAEELAKSERDTRVTKEFVELAKADYPSLALDAQKFGPVLKRASEALSSEDYEALQTVLKAAQEHVRQNDLILKELGRSGDPTPTDDSVEQLVARKAEQIRKADPNVSQFEAMRQANRDPEVQAAQGAQR